MKFTIFLALGLITLHMVACKPMPSHGNVPEFAIDSDTVMVKAEEPPEGQMDSVPVQVQPYNILNTQHVCPDGFILANNHCHKRIK